MYLTIKTLSKIKIKTETDGILMKKLKKALDETQHSWKLEMVSEDEYPIFKELKNWSDRNKRVLIKNSKQV